MKWKDYLENTIRPQMGPGFSDAARRFVAAAQVLFPGRLVVPGAGRTPSDKLMLCWDRDQHHMQVEFESDGTGEWFYIDHDRRSVESGDLDLGGMIDEELERYMRLVLR